MAKEKGETRILFLTDIHAPYHDQKALDIAIDFGLKKGCDQVIISELPDLYQVGSWLRDPTKDSFYQELEKVTALVQQLDKAFKGKDVTYIHGNHEERIDRYLMKRAPEMYGLKAVSREHLMGLDQTKWKVIDNKKVLQEGGTPYKVGNLTFLHGHEVKMGWGAINLAKIMYERSRVNIIAGHHHRAQEWVVRKISGKHEGCWLVGCLCDLHPEYLPHNDWVHGFAVVHMYKGGDFSVENRKIINGRVL